MRYELEISLIFVLYYYSKNIPQTENEIETCYSKYDWGQDNIEDNDNNPSNLEQYKKLFDTFLNYFTNSLVTFCNRIKEIIVEVFTIRNTDIFKKRNIQIKTDIILDKAIQDELKFFVNAFIDFWTKSEFSTLKDLRNAFTHRTSPIQINFEAKYNKELDFVEVEFKETMSTYEVIGIIKKALLSVESQTKSFKNLIDDYFHYLKILTEINLTFSVHQCILILHEKVFFLLLNKIMLAKYFKGKNYEEKTHLFNFNSIYFCFCVYTYGL